MQNDKGDFDYECMCEHESLELWSVVYILFDRILQLPLHEILYVYFRFHFHLFCLSFGLCQLATTIDPFLLSDFPRNLKERAVGI